MLENPKNVEVSEGVEKYSEAIGRFNKVFESIGKAKDYVDKNDWEIHFESYMTKGIPVEKSIILSKRIKNSKMFPKTLILSMVGGKFNLKFSDGGPTKVFEDVNRLDVVNKILPKFESRVMESMLTQWEGTNKLKEGKSKKGDEEDLGNLEDLLNKM